MARSLKKFYAYIKNIFCNITKLDNSKIKDYKFKGKSVQLDDLSLLIQRHIDSEQEQYIKTLGEANYVKIHACLDLISDCANGINSFKSGNYLNIFGVLQCFFVIQDSIKELGKLLVLSIDTVDYKDNSLRKVRNTIIGHPTTNNDGNFYIIDRYTLECDKGFKYRLRNKEGDTTDGLFIDYEEDFGKELESLLCILGKIKTELKITTTVQA